MRVLLICLLVFLSLQAASGFFWGITAMRDINAVVTFTKNALKLFGVIKDDTMEKKLGKTFDSVSEVSQQLDHFGNEIRNALTEVFGAVQRLEQMIELKDAQHRLSDYISRIQSLYEEFEAYVDDIEAFQKKTIEQFVDRLTSPGEGGLPTTLKNMYRLYAPGDTAFLRESILDQILGLQNLNSSETGCNNVMTIQQHVSEFYNFAVVHELKAFGLIVFAYGILADYDNRTYTREMEKTSAQTVLRMDGYLKKAREVMDKAQSRFVRCDPKEWVRDDTFVEMESAIRPFVVGEDQTGTYCNQVSTYDYKPCHRYGKAEWRRDPWAGEYKVWSKRDPWVEQCLGTCPGYVQECDYIGAPTVCFSPDGEMSPYQWVQGEGDMRLGPRDGCRGRELLVPTEHKDGHNFMCFCECIQDKMEVTDATRTFSFLPVVAETEYNMVVTGLKFVRKDNVIQIQIEQGVLIEDGKIEANSTEWLPLEELKYYQEDGGTFHKIKEDGTHKKLEKGKDFAMISKDFRHIKLACAKAPINHVITGVRFNKAKYTGTAEDAPKELVQIEIRATKFNFTTGDLVMDESASSWVTPDASKGGDSAGTELYLNQPDDSTKADLNEKDSKPNQYIEFQMTDRMKDVSSHTVPFFDSQPMHPPTRVGLGEIGIFHKGQDGFGGFLALDVHHLDFGKHAGPELTKKQIEEFEGILGKKKKEKSPVVTTKSNRKIKKKS